MEKSATTISDADRRILRVLQSEGRISASELARRTGMSETSCSRRLRSLEEAGIISGYQALVDQRKIGLPITVLIQVSTNQRTETDRKTFLRAITRNLHIVSCAAVSGSHDYVLEAVVHDIDELSDLTLRQLLELPSVASISSSIVIKWIKRNAPLPV